MYSKSRGINHVPLSLRDDDKYKGMSHSNRANLQNFVVIFTVLFLIWWFLLSNPFATTLADVEEDVARLLEGNGLNSLRELSQDDPALIDFIR